MNRALRPFVLLEVVLAMALFSLCFLPIASTPFFALRKEQQALQQIELERLSEVAFADFVVQIARGNIPWNRWKEENKYFIHTYEFTIDSLGTFSYQAHALLSIQQELSDHCLLSVAVVFSPISGEKFHPDPFVRDLYIAKKQLT